LSKTSPKARVSETGRICSQLRTMRQWSLGSTMRRRRDSNPHPDPSHESAHPLSYGAETEPELLASLPKTQRLGLDHFMNGTIGPNDHTLYVGYAPTARRLPLASVLRAKVDQRPARSQFWSRTDATSDFRRVWLAAQPASASAVRPALNRRPQTWKACWVHTLTSSNLVSSALPTARTRGRPTGRPFPACRRP
jgi:hypothetical protein